MAVAFSNKDVKQPDTLVISGDFSTNRQWKKPNTCEDLIENERRKLRLVEKLVHQSDRSLQSEGKNMYRLFFVLPFVFILTSNFGASRPVSQNDLVSLNSRNLNKKVSDLETKIQDLTKRLNGARVHCQNKVTRWDAASDKPIMYLDRQNVQCPHSYFLTRFQLGREANYNSARVRYYYRCCRFIL